MHLDEGFLEQFFVVFRSATIPDKALRLIEMALTTAEPLISKFPKGSLEFTEG